MNQDKKTRARSADKARPGARTRSRSPHSSRLSSSTSRAGSSPSRPLRPLRPATLTLRRDNNNNHGHPGLPALPDEGLAARVAALRPLSVAQLDLAPLDLRTSPVLARAHTAEREEKARKEREEEARKERERIAALQAMQINLQQLPPPVPLLPNTNFQFLNSQNTTYSRNSGLTMDCPLRLYTVEFNVTSPAIFTTGPRIIPLANLTQSSNIFITLMRTRSEMWEIQLRQQPDFECLHFPTFILKNFTIQNTDYLLLEVIVSMNLISRALEPAGTMAEINRSHLIYKPTNIGTSVERERLIVSNMKSQMVIHR